MLNATVLTGKDSKAVSRYYSEGADDYYAQEGDAKQWQGQGAARLNLTGEIDQKTFKQLLDGRIASIGLAKSSVRKDSKRRIGIDLTFSAPKSVSIQALVGHDLNIVLAHDYAVSQVIDYMEQQAQTRHKINGISHIETTANLIVGKFRHETSREIDPHLHTHAIIVNLTQRQDGEWRALKNDTIISMTAYCGALYRSILAHELEKLGYDIRTDQNGCFELAHITRQQIEQFSARSTQIEKLLSQQGLNRQTATTQEKQQATLKNRKKKQVFDRSSMFEQWCLQAKDLEINLDYLKAKQQRQSAPHTAHNNYTSFSQSSNDSDINELPNSQKIASQFSQSTALVSNNKDNSEPLSPAQCIARGAVSYAISHLSERESLLTHEKIIKTVINHTQGNFLSLSLIQEAIQHAQDSKQLIKAEPYYLFAGEVDPHLARTQKDCVNQFIEHGYDPQQAIDFVQEAIQSKQLIEQKKFYTTQYLLLAETAILTIERQGHHAVQPIYTQSLQAEQLNAFTLDAEQQNAVNMILTTPNRIVAIKGSAGTGKSHMLKAATVFIEQQHHKVMAIAPYGSHVRALRELDINANTISHFLASHDKHLLDEQSVLIIDEAGTVPTKTMKKILEVSQEKNCHVVLLGDTKQTKAIESGKPFDLLQLTNMPISHLTTIRRQEDQQLKKAVEYASYGKMQNSLNHIKDIVYENDTQVRYAHLVADYMELSPEQRQSTLIMIGTNQGRLEINAAVREQLGLTGQGHTYQTLKQIDMTQAQKGFNQYYSMGHIIRPEKNYPSGLKTNELYTIIETLEHNQIKVKSSKDEEIIFNPASYRKLSVYELTSCEFTPQDVVRITRGDKELNVINGEQFKVESITKDLIELKSDSKHFFLSTQKPLHLDHAYATTIHSSQGLTGNYGLIDLNTDSLTTNYENYYVAISRSRILSKIYTNDDKLLEPISIKTNKTAAHEIFSDIAKKFEANHFNDSHEK